MKLYELTGQFNEVFDLINNEDIDYQVLEDTLQSIEADIEAKAGNITKIILSLQKTADAYTSESVRLAAKAKSTSNRIKALKNYLLFQMEEMSKNKIITDVGTISRQKSPASVRVLAEVDIPKEYWYMPVPAPQLDKKALLDELKKGASIPGVQLHQGYHIRIR